MENNKEYFGLAECSTGTNKVNKFLLVNNIT